MGTARVAGRRGTVNLFDVVGKDSLTARFFIRHVGLALETRDFSGDEPLRVRLVEMNPPLSAADEPGAAEVDALASVELSPDEESRIKMFVDELIDEYQTGGISPRGQYSIHPHFVDRDAENANRRYSCVGFVVEAYRDADIELLDLERLPNVGVEMLVIAYPDHERLLREPRLRSRFGLLGEGPWPVLLPGYVLHAMNRSPSECRQAPYSTSSGEERFPTGLEDPSS